jgi:hypothetical protein
VLTFKKTRLSALLLPGILLLAAIAGPCLQPPLVALPKHEPCCGSIAPAGDHLASVLDDMNVESLWIAGQHINWETGEPDRGGDYEGPGNHTHCSAFSAAVAKRLGIYLLRPPEHGQSLLANAQSKWLETAAAEKEAWQRVPRMQQAQSLANQGKLVVVVYANPDSHVPGHVAIVRPSEKSVHALEDNGPEIIQAGTHNHNRTNVRIGFSNHPGAWPDGVSYYAHPIR